MNYTNPLYGRRILHVMSPVRWRSTKFMHQADSNYKVMMKTIKWLPDCHHFVLVPKNNTIPPMGDNVTLIPFPYAGSVLFNRGFFDSKFLYFLVKLWYKILPWRDMYLSLAAWFHP